MLENDRPQCGVVILCAKNDEQVAIVSALDSRADLFTKLERRQKGARLPAYQYYDPEGLPETLVVSETGMGNVQSASRTGYMLGTFRPHLIMFLGTAGSLNPEKCQVGDVVVPERGAISVVYNRIVCGEDVTNFPIWRNRKNGADLRIEDIDGREFAMRRSDTKTQLPLSNFSRQRIGEARETRKNRKRLEDLFNEGPGDSRKPVIHFDKQIYSNEYVIATPYFRQRVASEFESAIAVDMESYGFLMACDHFQQDFDKPVSSIIIRGISDLSDTKKGESYDKGLNDIAVANATKVAMEIINKICLSS